MLKTKHIIYALRFGHFNVSFRKIYKKMLSILTTNLCQQVPERSNYQKSPRVVHNKVVHKPMERPPSEGCVYQEGDINPEEKSLLDVTIDKIYTRNSKELVYGTVTGWAAGVGIVRVGRVAAFGLGGGVLLLHFAVECGYIHVNWDKVRESASSSGAWLEAVIKFIKRNSCYSVGFVGGFFFGVAST